MILNRSWIYLDDYNFATGLHTDISKMTVECVRILELFSRQSKRSHYSEMKIEFRTNKGKDTLYFEQSGMFNSRTSINVHDNNDFSPYVSKEIEEYEITIHENTQMVKYFEVLSRAMEMKRLTLIFMKGIEKTMLISSLS